MTRATACLASTLLLAGCYDSHAVDADGGPRGGCITLRDQGIVAGLTDEARVITGPCRRESHALPTATFRFCYAGPTVEYEVVVRGRAGDSALTLSEPRVEVARARAGRVECARIDTGPTARVALEVQDGDELFVQVLAAPDSLEETGTFELRTRPVL